MFGLIGVLSQQKTIVLPPLPLGNLIEFYDWYSTAKFADAALAFPLASGENDQMVAYIDGTTNGVALLSQDDTLGKKPRYLTSQAGLYFGNSLNFTFEDTSGQRWLHTDATVAFNATKKQIVGLSFSQALSGNDNNGPVVQVYAGATAIFGFRVKPFTSTIDVTVRNGSANTTNIPLGFSAPLPTLQKHSIVLVYDGVSAGLWVDGVKLPNTINVGANTTNTSTNRLRLLSNGPTYGHFIAHRCGFWNGDLVDTSDEAVLAIHQNLMAESLSSLSSWPSPIAYTNPLDNTQIIVEWPGRAVTASSPFGMDWNDYRIFNIGGTTPGTSLVQPFSVTNSYTLTGKLIIDKAVVSDVTPNTAVAIPPGTVLNLSAPIGMFHDSTVPNDFVPTFDISVTL